MSCVQSLLIHYRFYPIAAVLVVMATQAFSVSAAEASCWPDNPAGQRKCRFFRSHGGKLDLWLCEDKEGDCSSLGYIPLPAQTAEPSAGIPMELEKASPEAMGSPGTSAGALGHTLAAPP